MNEIVTPELKAKIHELFEMHDEMMEEQEEHIEQLQAETKQLRQENRLIDKNAAAVQKEYKAEIERLQSAYLRAVTERDNAIFQLTRREAERDKAVEDYSVIQEDGLCCVCQYIGSCTDKELCSFKWRGLERSGER